MRVSIRVAFVGLLVFMCALAGACGDQPVEDPDATPSQEQPPIVAGSESVLVEGRDERRGVHYTVLRGEPRSRSDGVEACFQVRLEPQPAAVFDHFSEDTSWSCGPRAALAETTDVLVIDSGFESPDAEYNHVMGTVAPEATAVVATFDDGNERVTVTNGVFLLLYDKARTVKRLEVVGKAGSSIAICDVKDEEDGFLVALCPAYRPPESVGA